MKTKNKDGEKTPKIRLDKSVRMEVALQELET